MNRLTMKELQPDYRPDEKFLKYGPASLTDAELLAIILRTGTKENCSVEVAENILGFEDINQQDILNIQYLDMKDLLSIRGVGTVKALQVKAVAELSQRISNTSRRKKLLMSDPESIAQYYMERMRHSKIEMVIVLLLNSACELIKDITISQGTVNSTLFSPREIFIAALDHDAVSIVLVHNHPSGNTKPSKNDIEATKRVVEAGELIGIQVLDHIIIGDRKYTSFKETGLINN